MCNLAAEQTSSWLMVDPWEAFQSYQRTAVVLDHFDYEINSILGGVFTEDGEQKNVRVMLLAGSDLISTMSEPGVWSYTDVSLAFIHPRSLIRRTSILLFNYIERTRLTNISLRFLVARPYSRALWNPNRRTCRFWHGPSHRQPGSLAAQHPPYITTYTK